jgi:general secretion pathway protein K
MAGESRRAVAAPSERGFIIVAVLWILAALAALAMIFSVYLSNSAQALAVTDTGLQTEALVAASLDLTTYQLLLAGDKARPALGSFHFRLDKAEVLVSFTSEAARVDLNFASKEMLANLFAVLGADEKIATEAADRIIGWRTQPKANAANDEEALYAAAGLTYLPRQSFFTHVNELSLVLGVPPELIDRALPFVTVFNGSAKVDALIAPPEVIAALPGMTPAALNDFLKQRPTLPRDQSAIAAALGPAQANAALSKSKSFRVLTTLRFDNGRRTSSEAVIALGEEKDKDKDPYQVLSWQDDVEAGHRPRKLAGG